jgi:signal transduction histidine kinase/sugar lactone lactonase YvrE
MYAGLSNRVLTCAVHAMVAGGPGEVIIGGYQGVVRFSNDKVEAYPLPSSLPILSQTTLLRDREGSLWIGSRDAGLVHVHQGKVDVYTQADGLSGNWVQSMFEDREGNIWVATRNGIDRFHEYAIPTISVKQGLSSTNVYCVLAAKDGSVWLGTSDGLNRWKDGKITVYHARAKSADRHGIVRDGNRGEPRGNSVISPSQSKSQEVIANGLPDNRIDSLYEDPRGRIWISTIGGLAYFENGHFFSFSGGPFIPSNPIAGDKSGNLYITDHFKGVLRLREGKVSETIPWAKLGLRGALGNPLATDPVNGGLWIASWNGGVVYFKDGKVRESYRPDSGLAPWRVNSLQFDSSGALWAAIDGGLSRIKNGHVITLNSKNGLPCDAAHDLLEDDTRSLWVYTACGLVRIARSEVNAWVADPARRIDFTVFGVSDGVRIRQGIFNPAPRSAKTADGRLWFLPFDGALIVNPSHLPTNLLPPPVHIEQLIADGQIYEAAQGLRLPPHVFDLVVNYTALSMVDSEKVRFRFKLEGQDRDWREVVNDRKVQYTNLPPGPYRFRVTACNNSGIWNEQGDTLVFSIAPEYYQTTWFRAICAAALLILVWAAYQYRVRQLHREFALTLDARVDERTRIARELHDTLLQSFHGVLLRLQTASQLLRERSVEAQGELDSTINQVAEAITEGRDAVQGLRESTVQENDLARAISALGDEFVTDAADNRPQFRVAVEGTTRNLHPILRDEIYRIAAEALRNAFRHAHARKVEVEIHYDDEQFRLRMRDDGKGIDPAVLSHQGSEGHFGLRGMRERATLIGGKLTVWSEVEAGTEVELRVPAGLAYASAQRASWLSKAFAGKKKDDSGDSA